MEKLYGNYLGICINNHDPEFRGRVQIFIPHIMPALYERWNKEGADKKIQLVGNNLETALPQEDIEQLKLMLPWAEAAAPIFGNSVAGHYNQQSGNFNQTYGTENQAAAANIAPSTTPSSIADLGAERRAYFASQLQDPNILNRLNFLANREVGSDLQQQTAFLETVFNRTQFSGSNFSETLFNSYWGSGAGSSPISSTTSQAIANVLGGSNITNFATDNASNAPGNPVADNRINAGVTGGWFSGGQPSGYNQGEFFYRANGSGGYSSTAGLRANEYARRFGSNSASSLSLNDPTAGLLNASSNPAQTTPHGKPNPEVYIESAPSNNAIQETPGGSTGSNRSNGSVIQNQSTSARSRKGPLSSGLIQAIETGLQGSGLNFVVFSGSQTGPGASRPPNASGRHDFGRAADGDFVDTATGRILNPATNQADRDRIAAILPNLRAAGIQGIGYDNSGYMGPSRFHLDIVSPAIWGADRTRATAEPWVVAAVGGQEGPMVEPGEQGEEVRGTSMVRNPTETQTSVTDTNGMPQGLFSVPNPGAMLWVFFREGDPLYPVYFAASYGAQEWKNAFKGSSPDAHYPQEGDTTPRNQAIFRPNQSGGMSFVDTITDEEDCRSIRVFHSNGSHLEFHQRGSILYQPFEHMQQVAGNAYNSCLNREDWTQGINNNVTIGDRITIVGNMSQEALDIIDQHAQIVKEINKNMLKGGGGPNGGAPSKPLNVTPNTPGLTVTPNANIINGFENTVTGPITPVTPNANLINGFQGTNLTTITPPAATPPAATPPPTPPTVTVAPANGLLNGIL